jgi:delta-aminolevulinic acid dehydratase/porphobilinogen synthase
MTVDPSAQSQTSRRIRRSHTFRDLGTALALDHSDVVLALQIKPELGTISKISTEPDSRICGDRPASIKYVCDATRWYAEIERESICAELACL